MVDHGNPGLPFLLCDIKNPNFSLLIFLDAWILSKLVYFKHMEPLKVIGL